MCCAYAAGERPPNQLNPEALEIALRTAMLCDCLLPDPLIVMRQHRPLTEVASGWQRSCLVGLEGNISYLTHHLPLTRIFLEEYLQPSDLANMDPLLHTGSAQIRLEVKNIPRDQLHIYLTALQPLTEATGQSIPTTGRWVLTLELPQQGALSVAGIHQPTRVTSLLPWLEEQLPAWQERRHTETRSKEEEKLKQGEYLIWQPTTRNLWEPDPEHTWLPLKKQALTAWKDDPYPRAWQIRAEMKLLKLPSDAIEGILRMGHARLYQRCRQANPKVPVSVWGELLYSWPRALQRKGVPIHTLTSQRYLAIASLLGMGRCQREVLRDLLAFTAMFPDISVRHLLLQKMGVTPLSEAALERNLPTWLEGPLPRQKSWRAREKFWMGRLMRHVRGSLPGAVVRSALYKYFAASPPSEDDRCEYPPAPYKKRAR